MPARTRTTNIASQSTLVYTITDTVGGTQTTEEFVGLSEADQKWMNDVTDPHFYDNRRKGAVIMNPLSACRARFNSPRGSFTGGWEVRNPTWDLIARKIVSTNGGVSLTHWDSVFGRNANGWALTPWVNTVHYASKKAELYPSPSGLSGIEQRVLASVLAQAASSDVLAIVTLKELDKTLESLDRLKTLIPRFVGWVKSRSKHDLNPRGLLRFGAEAASQWLEYRYGFMQIYYDVKSFSQLLDLSSAPRVRYTSRETQSAFADPLVSYDGDTISNTTWTTNRSTIVECIGGALVKHYGASSLCDLGFDQLLTSSWELVPYSFVIDWFFDTSKRIAAWQGRLDRKVVGTWVTTRTTMRAKRSFSISGVTTVYNSNTWIGNLSGGATADEEVVELVRLANPSLSVLPQIKIRLDSQKLLDLAALLYNSGLRNVNQIIRDRRKVTPKGT